MNCFRELASGGALYGIEANGYFVDIGVPASLELARRELAGRRTRPAAFLDLDAGIGATLKIKDLGWKESVIQAVGMLNRARFYVFVVDSQKGSACCGGEDSIDEFHTNMQNMALAADTHIDAFYSVPHHAAGSINETNAQSCTFANRLLNQAADDWYIDRPNSFFIGTKESDLGCGSRIEYSLRQIE